MTSSKVALSKLEELKQQVASLYKKDNTTNINKLSSNTKVDNTNKS